MQFPEQITIGSFFFLFAYGAFLATMQLVAAHQRLVGLSLWPRRPRAGYFFSLALFLASYLWFFGTKGYQIFSPGPASSEFAFFLGCGFLAALLTSLLLPELISSLSPYFRKTRPESHPGQGGGRLYLPSGPPPWPAICLLLGAARTDLKRLSHQLVKDGFAVLALDITSFEYPEVLTIMAQGMAHLASHSDVDRGRIGALGVDLGGDLAIRAASADQEIRAVAALSPLLSEETVKPGLAILSEMTYLEGRRWLRRLRRGRLVGQIAAREHLPLIERSCLLLWGKEDRLASPLEDHPSGVEVESIAGEGHLSLPQSRVAISSMVGWFQEQLGG